MDPRLWLLVEWVDEQNVFSNYGVVNTNSLLNYEADLHTGKVVFIRDKHSNGARKAQVLRVSDNKHHVKELKLMLERQDHQVKNVLSLCMNTIKEMKTGSMYWNDYKCKIKKLAAATRAAQNMTGGGAPQVRSMSEIERKFLSILGTDFGSGLPGVRIEPFNEFYNPNQTQSLNYLSGQNSMHQVQPGPDTSGSDSDNEVNPELNMTKTTMRFNNFQVKRPESAVSGHMSRIMNDNTVFNNRRSLVSSTPLPERPANITRKLLLDQGTQTDPIIEYTPSDKIEELESVLHRLYSQFITLISDLHISDDQSLTLERMSVRSDHNIDEVREESATERQNTPSVDLEAGIKGSAKGLQVRRASAQTTNTGLPIVENNDGMVSLGSGNVTVPARLMTEIDWTSYTAATRHLLQAVFPRKVLATHSLTGKQSPAFIDRPPKKRLDPKLVDDIVFTVSKRCNVPKRIVRGCITTKCTDEAKLYRNRQHFKKIRDQQNRENVSPSPASSNESSNARD